MTPERIKELRLHQHLATPGEWKYTGHAEYTTTNRLGVTRLLTAGPLDPATGLVAPIVESVPYTETHDDFSMLVDAVNALPELLDEVERLQSRMSEECERRRELEAENAELKASVKMLQGFSQEEWRGTLCPECGPSVPVDEDGCCTTCGIDAMGLGVETAWIWKEQRDTWREAHDALAALFDLGDMAILSANYQAKRHDYDKKRQAAHALESGTNKPSSEAWMDNDGDPDLSVCPNCGGPADNGHDRRVPPNVYHCTKCESGTKISYAHFETNFTCNSCGKEDHLMGYPPNSNFRTRVDPPPTVRCTCGWWNRLVRV